METLNVVKNILAKKVDVTKLTTDSKLSDLGLDSLDLVEVMLEIEDELKIEFSTEEISSLTTLGSVLELINKKTA